MLHVQVLAPYQINVCTEQRVTSKTSNCSELIEWVHSNHDNKKKKKTRFLILIHSCARLPIIAAHCQPARAFQQCMNYASGQGNRELFCVREKKPSHVRLPTTFHWSHYLFICFLLSHGKSHISPQMCYCWSCGEEIDSTGAGVVEFKKVRFSSSPDYRLSSNCSLSI